MHEGEQPGRRLRALRHERVRTPPRGEERVLHSVLRERLVAKDPKREPVCDAPEPVVQLCERLLVRASDEGDDGLVGQVREGTGHRGDSLAHRF